MASEAEINRLVELITQRVQGQIGQTDARNKECISFNPSDCETCQGCHTKRTGVVQDLVELGMERLAAGIGHEAPPAELAPLIDHTLLKPNATKKELKQLCEEAAKHGFATVCVNPSNVRYCAALLEGSGVRPIAVVGFPLGASTPNSKAFEAREAVRNGAQEIDMVINIGALKERDYRLVQEDIAAVVSASSPKPVKVILETGGLNDEEKVIGCTLSKVAGAAFVKTSTGFGPGGATADDIALMRAVVGPAMGVKASGGVRTREDVHNMIDAGATRVGASGSVSIVSGKKAAGGY